MESLTKIQCKIEAILFLENNFISKKELVKKLNTDMAQIEESIKKINQIYSKYNHSFHIITNEDNVLMVINRENASTLTHLYKEKRQNKFSKALIETMTIIAYTQPVTKSEIDEYRGVNSESTLKTLLSQDMIQIVGNKPVPGTPNQYGTTNNFLRTFGLQSIKDLPKLQEQDIQKFETNKKSIIYDKK